MIGSIPLYDNTVVMYVSRFLRVTVLFSVIKKKGNNIIILIIMDHKQKSNTIRYCEVRIEYFGTRDITVGNNGGDMEEQ